MNFLKIKMDDIKEYKNNPRFNEKAIDYVKKSIEDYGYLNPILIDKNNVIVAGHTRYKALKELNKDEVEVIKLDDLNDNQIKSFRIVDNKVAELSSWDNSKLLGELKNFSDEMKEELKEFNFEYNDTKNLKINEEDFVSDEEIIEKKYVCPYCGEMFK